MAQLKERNGIACDMCKLPYRNHFTYYSSEIRIIDEPGISLISNRLISVQKSLDVCENCYSDLVDKVKSNYKPAHVGLNCDLTGKPISGKYYYIDMTMVKVKVDQPPTVTTRPRHLELNVGINDFNSFIEQKGSSWSASSE